MVCDKSSISLGKCSTTMVFGMGVVFDKCKLLSPFIFIYSIVLVHLHLITVAYGFNLETRLPLVKHGQRNSYFGYSVAQHIIIDEVTKRITEAA